MSPRHVPASVTELQSVPLLAELPGERLLALAKRMRREELGSGMSVVLEGEPGAHFYVVLSGLLAVSHQGGLGPRRVLRPGSYFGEVALAMDVPRTASVTALTPTKLASCDQETFDEFLRPLFADDSEHPSNEG